MTVFEVFVASMYGSIRNSLIDKSISDEELGGKILFEIDFAKQYGFFMKRNSLSEFNNTKKCIDSASQFILKPLILKTRIKFLFYIIYIKLTQRKLRMQAGQRT
jgi:hypothetical protein